MTSGWEKGSDVDVQSFDYIVIGSGSAGSVVANRLSGDPSINVLLIEAGGSDRNFWLRLPVGYYRTIYDKRFAALFKTEPEPGTAGRSIDWPRGRVLGGSSSINGLIFIRGQHADFDDWARAGGDGWSFRDVLPYFRRLERYEGGDSQYRGGLGDMQVSDLRNDHPCCRAWVAAAQQYGLPANADFNGETTHGVGAYQLSIGGRWRASAARMFLDPARNRPNLIIMDRTRVSRILIENGRAVGVEFIGPQGSGEARAGAEVVLSAGAIESPQLLQLSGIGPADHLHSLGIPVHADLPGVGGNLQDHYQTRSIVHLKRNISLNNDIRNPVKLAAMGLEWLINASGPLTVGAGQVGGAACTKFATDGRPDIQFNVMPLSVDKPGLPLHRYPGFTATVWQCHPDSRGRIDIRSADPLEAPRIVPNYLSAQRDRDTIVEGVKILREIYRQPAFRDLWDKEITPGADCADDAQILDYVRRTGGTVYHCSGTCRMGSDADADAVVDSQLRVRGIDGLRVVDASIMPKITSANTNAPTLMIGEKGAHAILQARSKPRQDDTNFDPGRIAAASAAAKRVEKTAGKLGD